MKKIIAKRSFKGPKESVFTSPYYTSRKWAAIILMPPKNGKVPSVAIDAFFTRSEAIRWNPPNGNTFFDTQDLAEKHFKEMKSFIKQNCKSITEIDDITKKIVPLFRYGSDENYRTWTEKTKKDFPFWLTIQLWENKAPGYNGWCIELWEDRPSDDPINTLTMHAIESKKKAFEIAANIIERLFSSYQLGPEASKGHIQFSQDLKMEYFIEGENVIYCETEAPIMIEGVRYGRFFCRLSQYEGDKEHWQEKMNLRHVM